MQFKKKSISDWSKNSKVLSLRAILYALCVRKLTHVSGRSRLTEAMHIRTYARAHMCVIRLRSSIKRSRVITLTTNCDDTTRNAACYRRRFRFDWSDQSWGDGLSSMIRDRQSRHRVLLARNPDRHSLRFRFSAMKTEETLFCKDFSFHLYVNESQNNWHCIISCDIFKLWC